MTNNDQQNIIQKTKRFRNTNPLKTGSEPERSVVPVSLVTADVLLLNDTNLI